MIINIKRLHSELALNKVKKWTRCYFQHTSHNTKPTSSHLFPKGLDEVELEYGDQTTAFDLGEI